MKLILIRYLSLITLIHTVLSLNSWSGPHSILGPTYIYKCILFSRVNGREFSLYKFHGYLYAYEITNTNYPTL